MTERRNIFTAKGNPVTLLGNEAKVGQKSPSFKVMDADLSEITQDQFKNKIKLIASVPSLDTPVCETDIKRFNDEAAGLSKDIAVIFISMDLPFAQKRFCGAYDIKKVKTFSDHKDADFGTNFGVLIKELRLLSRAIFIIDKDDTVKYVEYVKELTDQPDFKRALEALKKLV